MNNKIAGLILAFAASVATVGTMVDPAVKPNGEVFGPSNVEVGSLVLLRVQGKDVRWQVFPPVAIESYGDENAFLATSFKVAGDYLVICSFLDSTGKVQLENQLISATPELAPPQPTTEPTTEPTTLQPAPTIDPTVGPTPDSFPNTKYPDVVADVEKIAKGMDKDLALKLGNNFKLIADNIGNYSSVKEVLRETAALNRPLIKVGVVSTQIQLIVSKKRFSGEVETLEDYADLWTQIAEGLIRYAQN